MHELAVCQGVMSQVTGIVARHRARAVEKIVLRIGPLSGVEPLLLEQAFPLAAVGSAAEHAALVIEAQPVRVRCSQCGAESETPPNRLLCGVCGHWRTQLLSGDEMILASVELSGVGEQGGGTAAGAG